ncbi:protein WVD2-like 7 isoform X1 [Populus nigra]|uniref:protein WVD2-like 7 isoform X1 n=1 Tax=Populus nigra TaxID=3691 RepID=UPI002B26E70E|nr:protein WVD2-like 7 isoform X1 [Populus nigra]
MGDTTCVMQPFSYAAGISNDAKEGNPTHALGQSISFGRFMSDSLSWEKWSSFSNNRYVEEAEKFSRPGSVAQKKAFFEAHYRNLAARKAAALLEQANAEASNVQEPENEGGIPDKTTQDSLTVATNSQEAGDREEVYVQQVNSEASFVADDNTRTSNVDMERFESSNVEEVEPSAENEILVENCVKIETLNQIVKVDNKEEVKEMELSVSKQMEKPLLKDFMSCKDDAASMSKKKPAVSSSKSSIYDKASKLPSTPAKPAPSVRAKKENTATPISKKSALESVERRKPTPKSTHKSMNFTPAREFNRITSSIIRKIDNSRVGSHSKSSKDCPTPSRTPMMMVSIAESKHPLATPQSEKRRAKTPLHPSTSGSKTVRSKWHFLPKDCSMFMTSSRNRSQSPSASIPFSFRTEERAARRKEKLEEKFNAYQAQKVQLQVTLKEKAETELKRLRQSLCFKARPLPDFYKQRVAPNNQMEKVPLTHSESPEPGRKMTPSKIRSASQLPQWSSLKNSGSKDAMQKKSDNPRSLASRLKASPHENTSPNIQHE